MKQRIDVTRVMQTPSFYERYPNFETFSDVWQSSPFYMDSITEEELKHIYFHILGEYMTSHYKYINTLQQDLQTMNIIHDYYPNLKKRIELQEKILSLTIEEMGKGGTQITAGMQNNDTDTVSATEEDMPFISRKTTQTNKLSTPQALTKQYNMIVDGLWDAFIKRFSSLFIMLIIGTDELFYMDDEEWNSKQ